MLPWGKVSMFWRAGSSIVSLGNWLTRVGGFVAMGAVFAMTALIVVEVIMRNLFSRSTLVADELGGYLNAVLVFMALAYTLQKEAHIRLELLFTRLPPKAQHILELCTCALSLVVSILLARWAWHFVADNYSAGTVSWTVLYTPQYIPQLSMGIGLSILTLQVAINLVAQISRVWTRRWLGKSKETSILEDQGKDR